MFFLEVYWFMIIFRKNIGRSFLNRKIKYGMRNVFVERVESGEG